MLVRDFDIGLHFFPLVMVLQVEIATACVASLAMTHEKGEWGKPRSDSR